MNPLILASDLKTKLHEGDAAVLVDCRFSLADPNLGYHQYQTSHLPGARYAHLNRDLSAPVISGRTGRHPLPSVSAAALSFGALGINDESLVIAYDDAQGTFASRLWWMLRWLGHDRVVVLDGGWAAWLAAGGDTTTELSSLQPTQFIPREQPGMTVAVQDVENAQAQGLCLVDAREAPRYRGEVEPIDGIAGHIPGAMNWPFRDNLEGGRFPPTETLRSRLDAGIPKPPASVVVYCGSGVTACHLLLAADHAGIIGWRLYPGSYSEWIADGTRRVETG